MKKIILALATLAIISCKKEEKPVDYTLFTGKITNKLTDSISLMAQGLTHTIKVDENGNFSDTLRLKDGKYFLTDGKIKASVYVKKGEHFNMNFDTNNPFETVAFTGKGGNINSFFVDATKLQKQIDYINITTGDKANFDNAIADLKAKHEALEAKGVGLDSITLMQQSKGFEAILKQLTQGFEMNQKYREMAGKPSVVFNYENHKGGTTSLNDLKGKYTYIDVWATWCGPCKREIPFLKEIEKEYHGKDIQFVSISLDKNKAAWEKMVTDQELGGIQLHYGNDKEFPTAYGITGIPRFILLDPQGNIIDANAPRPSDPRIKELFTAQGI